MFTPIIGNQSLLTDSNTKLLDIPTLSSISSITHLTKGIVVVSPRLAVVESDATSESWSNSITDTWKTNPRQAPTRIRYRPSHPSKTKTYAEVQATSEQLRNARARAGHQPVPSTTSKPETLRATITTNLEVEGQLETWLPALMHSLSIKSGVSLQFHTGTTGLPWNHWKAIMDYDGQWSGKVVVQLSTREGLHALHKTTTGTALEIHGHHAALRCSSEHMDL